MPTERHMQEAVRRRDATQDGRFVYAVVTTGVYCRPSCGARAPRAENLRFFDTGEAAAAAGYRPCRRCRPDEPFPRFDDLVAAARLIEANPDAHLTVTELATRAGLSPGRFRQAFRKAFGITPRAYRDAVRLRRLKSSLKAGDDVAGATYEAGYGSSSRLYDGPARNIGMTPSAYRAGGEGEAISWACRPTPLGPVLLAATERGVCFAQFGADEPSLLAQLAAEFPRARLSPSPAGAALDGWIKALVSHLGDGTPRPELPLDLRGTAFQMRVWQFLLRVPEGDVVSYGEVAAGIEQPTAVRAVASACAANRVAVLVPCHRVIRADGSSSGYRWGVERKRALLDAERARRERRPARS